ncbi:MAG: DUF4139 domain-containing protein [bacterium]|jgi:hypothetical protein
MTKSFPGVLALSILLVWVLPVQAEDLAVTVYNTNLGVIKDARVFELKSGYNEISMVDIAARIDPTSVRINLDGQGEITVVEQNFQYDLLSPGKLLEKYLDDSVMLVTEGGKEFEGKLLGFDNSSMVVEVDRGGVVIVSREQVTDVSLPPGRKDLIVKPTLVYQVYASRNTTATAEVAYMTEGMNWHAEYVAVLGEDDDTMEISSWVSVDNRSGATYEEARLKLIAGDVHRVPKKGIEAPEAAMEMRYAAAPQPIEEKAFFEYHMYTVPRPTTIRDREVKQIQFLPETDIETEKIYNFDAQKGTSVRVVMEFENSRENNLGVPLPGGKVRVFKADDDGSLEFIGEDSIDHTPKDEDVKVYVGDAFDIVAERKRTNYDRVSDRVVVESYEIRVRNHKDEAIEVVVSEHIYGDWSIRESSHEYEKKKADLVEFVLPVGVDGETILTYTVRRRY